jgi:rhodanese-related sulfurtransferase
LLNGLPGWKIVEGVSTPPFDAAMSKNYDVSTEAATLSGTFDYPTIKAEGADAKAIVANAAGTYFTAGTKNIKADALYELLHDGDTANDPILIDLRKAEDYALGHIPGAVNIPAAKLFTAETLAQLDPTKQIVVNCYTGQTSSQAVSALNELGYKAFSLSYGLPSWKIVAGVSSAPFNASMSKGYAVETTVAIVPQTAPTTGTMLPDWTAWFVGGLALLLMGLGLRRAVAR